MRTLVLGFAATLAVVACAAVMIARAGLPTEDPGSLRLVDATGAVSIGNDREGQAILTAAGLAPGRSVRGQVTVSAGSAALRLSESDPVDTAGRGGGRLSERLTLEVADVTGGSAGPVLYTGPLRGLPPTALGASAGTRTYRFVVGFPDGAAGSDNAYMAASTTVAFAWDTDAGEPSADAGYGEQVAYDAPLATWRLDGDDAKLANGVVSGITGVLGTASAARFDGASGYAYVNGVTAPRWAYTLEAWIRPAGGGDMTIVEQGGAGSLLVRDGHVVFRQTGTEITGGPVNPGAWHHVAGTWDGETARLYVDGDLQASAPAAQRPSGASTVYIGYGQFAPWFAGDIDHVAYYPTALSLERLRAHRAAASPAPAATSPPPAASAPRSTEPAPVVTASKRAPSAADASARRQALLRARVRARNKARALARRRAAQRRAAKRHASPPNLRRSRASRRP